MRYAPRLPVDLAPPLLIVAAALLVVAAASAGGSVMLAAFTALVAAGYAVFRPWLVFSVLLLAVVLLEDDKSGFLSFTSGFYDGTIVPTDLLFATLIAAVTVDLARTGVRPQTPGPFAAPLVALLLVSLGGAVTGHYDGATLHAVLSQLRPLLYLIVLPFLYVNIGPARDATRKLLLAAMALAGIKAVEGLIGFVLGQGHPLNDGVLTYISPAPNWLLLFLLLTLLAASLEGARTPAWSKLGAPLAFAALLFAFRRSFYIAGAFGFGLILVVARGAKGRRAAVAAGAIAVVFALGGLLGGGPVRAVTDRALSLNPAEVSSTTEDRYRVGERRNVVWQVRHHPVMGLGLGVPWSAHYPLSFEYSGGRQYTHVVALWYWLKLGIAGLAVYLWLMATALWASYRVWRKHPDALVRSAGLALLAMFIGLLFMETTQSFTGVEPRFTIIEAATFGWLAVAMRARRTIGA